MSDNRHAFCSVLEFLTSLGIKSLPTDICNSGVVFRQEKSKANIFSLYGVKGKIGNTTQQDSKIPQGLQHVGEGY